MSTIDERIEKHERLAEKARKSIERANDILDKMQNKINYHENAIENLNKKKNKAKPKQIVTEIKEQGVVITETPKTRLVLDETTKAEQISSKDVIACDPEDRKPAGNYEVKDVN